MEHGAWSIGKYSWQEAAGRRHPPSPRLRRGKEDRSQRSDDRGQRTEDRRQRATSRRQKTEVFDSFYLEPCALCLAPYPVEVLKKEEGRRLKC